LILQKENDYYAMMVQKWDSLYIFCFSGTGNALASSKWIADEAERRGLKSVVQQIDNKEDLKMPGSDENPLIGFAFPTHGFNAAPVMLRFVAGFPGGLGKEVFLLNTRAGMKLSKIFIPGFSGLALLVPAFILWIKGYQCIGFRPVDLPSNWIPLHPGIKEKVIESIFTRCEGIVRRFAGKIFSGKKVYRGLMSIPADLLISPVALAYYIGGRFFLSKTFIANNKCNSCGICIKDCPTSSIKMVNNRPYWKLTCESCMRCLNNCPVRGIEAAHGMATAFIILITAVNTRLLVFMVDSLKIQPEIWWWKLSSNLISIAIMVIVSALLYHVVHYLMAIKPVRYLVRYTSLTTFPFWRRYTYLKNRNKNRRSE
jgi:Pyruvate/2-oxoacid:ferredoxin oxidoreductase delta subunit